MPYPKPNSVNMLNGDRFKFGANQQYRAPKNVWESVKSNPTAMQPIIQWFVEDHYTNQLPRILTLERYYQGANDIKFWHSDKPNTRADNRVASGLPRYITNIRVGYQFGNPIKFGYSNPDDENDTGDKLTQTIEKFNTENDEAYHEKVMGKNLNNTGRAYELLYVREDTNLPAIKAINPANSFVVYDTTIEQHSLFAVRYYMNEFMDKTTYYVEVYTDEAVFYFTADNQPYGNLVINEQLPHYFGKVPITEYQLNDECIGAWEPKLDEIDAYDKSLSEMANSQEDFSNAILAISGDIDSDEDSSTPLLNADGEQMYDEDGHKLYKVKRIDPTQNIIFLKPSVIDKLSGVTVIPTDAKYLTKEFNAPDWKIYVDRLLADIHKDTNTPDVTDENFAANASGVAMSYKLWGSDQERATQEALYKRGLMRRLRLLGTYWSFISQISSQDMLENIKITFTPNLPKNDAETVANMQSLSATGAFSSETMQEMGETITGIPASQESKRMDKQGKEDQQKTQDMLNQTLTDQAKNGGVVDDN